MIRSLGVRNFRNPVCACALLSIIVALGACSSATPSATGGSSAGTAGAGAMTSTGGSTSNNGGASGAGAPGAAGTNSGVSGTTSVGGASGGGGMMSVGGAGGASGGSGGMSAGGMMGSGGTSDGGGLGGTTNSLGTITGSPAIAKLLALTANCTAANKIASDTGKFQTDAMTTVHVCSLPGGAGNTGGAIYYTADMDIDCDGLTTTHCPGTGADKDPSYDDQTSFSGPNSKSNAKGPSLASENTPYVVIPEEVQGGIDQNNGGNIVAVIYKNQLEFAVFGDQIQYQQGDPGEPIGEASVRTAVGLGIPSSPASGGVGGGVTYIAFAGPGSQPKDMENIAEVQALGAKLVEALLANNP